MDTPSLVFLFFFFSVALSSSPAHPKHYTFELIHRDSPLSPLYNPQNTETDRLNAAFLRSISRSRRFNHQTDLQSGLIGLEDGEFFMSITIGTPPEKFHALVDTGSDLVWVQCQPCKNCSKATVPPFHYNNSSTYKNETCESSHCKDLLSWQQNCDMYGNLCQYNVTYGDGSFSIGHLATETISIDSASGSPVSFPGTIFGCGYSDGGLFNESGSGVIGLGDGPLSLISQLSSSITKKFSYCLSHNTKAKSHINLGTNSIPSGLSKHSGVISTPLANKDSVNNHYYLTLEAISVGKTKIPFTGKSFNPDAGTYSKTMGNIIIDSGTSWTLLDSGFLDKFVAVMEESIKGAKRVNDPEELFSYCFKADNAKIILPKITVHFTRADIRLSQLNAFVKRNGDIFCLSMNSTTGVAIYGSYAQMDFFVGYDLVTRTVSFQPMNCSAIL